MELYLVSGDYIDFELPVRILQFEKAMVLNRKCLLVTLEKYFDYSSFGIDKAVNKFILIDRFEDARIHKLKEFPVEVHVFIPKDPSNPLLGFSKWSELFNAAWANIYDSFESAKENKG